MRPAKPRCRRCDRTANIKTYLCSFNILKVPMKTHYCDQCVDKFMHHLKEKNLVGA